MLQRARWCATALLLCVVPLPAQTVKPVHFRTMGLELPLPGLAVVQDSARWATLQRRFGKALIADFRFRPPHVVPIDFARQLLVLVGAGEFSAGCSNVGEFVRSVEERADSIVVHVGPDPDLQGPRVTCMEIVYPLDVVRLPKTGKPLAFHGRAEWLRPAPWWLQPSVAELDQLPRRERDVLTRALALDPETPAAVAQVLARRWSKDNWTLDQEWLARPDVRRSPRALSAIALRGGHSGEEATRVLAERHGIRVAGDPGTPAPVLRLLIRYLITNSPEKHRRMAELLLRNPTVRNNRQTLGAYTWLARPWFPDLLGEACRSYLGRWSAWTPILDAKGRPTGEQTPSTECPAGSERALRK